MKSIFFIFIAFILTKALFRIRYSIRIYVDKGAGATEKRFKTDQKLSSHEAI